MWNVGFFENFWVILRAIVERNDVTSFSMMCAINLAIGWYGYRPISRQPITIGRYFGWLCVLTWCLQMRAESNIYGQASIIAVALGGAVHFVWDVIYQGALERY